MDTTSQDSDAMRTKASLQTQIKRYEVLADQAEYRVDDFQSRLKHFLWRIGVRKSAAARTAASDANASGQVQLADVQLQVAALKKQTTGFQAKVTALLLQLTDLSMALVGHDDTDTTAATVDQFQAFVRTHATDVTGFPLQVASLQAQVTHFKNQLDALDEQTPQQGAADGGDSQALEETTAATLARHEAMFSLLQAKS